MNRFLSMFSCEEELVRYLKCLLDDKFCSTILLVASSINDAKFILEKAKSLFIDSFFSHDNTIGIFKYKQNLILGTSLRGAREFSNGNLLDGIIIYRPQVFPYFAMEEIYMLINKRAHTEDKIPCDD